MAKDCSGRIVSMFGIGKISREDGISFVKMIFLGDLANSLNALNWLKVV